jgi:hypothetical protein
MMAQLKQIEDKTCIRFVTQTYQTDYVRIGNYGGCWSWNGRIGGRQDLSMGFDAGGTCLWVGTMMHEMMHAIGIEHMHADYNRDDYVTIFLENVDSRLWSNFEKVNPSSHSTFNTPYDLLSVMHYGKWAFSNNGKDVIVPHDPNYLDIIGTPDILSAGDAMRLNRMHLCMN